VLAIILGALWRLGKAAVKGTRLLVLGAGVAGAALLGVMVAVTIQLGAATLTTWQAWVIAALAAVAVLGWKVPPAWLVVGGAAAGWLLGQV
jgi:chromate transport protein ChrA